MLWIPPGFASGFASAGIPATGEGPTTSEHFGSLVISPVAVSSVAVYAQLGGPFDLISRVSKLIILWFLGDAKQTYYKSKGPPRKVVQYVL